MSAMARALAALGLLLCGTGSALADCSVSAVSTSFGSYDPFGAVAVDSTGSVTVSCQFLIGVLVGYTIQLSSGTGGSYAPRTLSGTGYQLDYNLYTNAGRTAVWGDGSGGTNTVSDGYLVSVLFPVVRNYTVYGRLPAGQNVPPGSYTDTVIVTVNY